MQKASIVLLSPVIILPIPSPPLPSQSHHTAIVPTPSNQLARHIRELALLQLRLPENRIRVIEPMLDPPLLLNMIQVNIPTRIRIPMRRSQDTASPQLQRLLLGQIVLILRIQHTVRKGLSRADTEQVARQPRAVGVDVVERGAFGGGDARAHGAHGEAHAFVAVDYVGEDLGGGGDGDAALLAELVEAALHA